jgi:hypothetical protein
MMFAVVFVAGLLLGVAAGVGGLTYAFANVMWRR